MSEIKMELDATNGALVAAQNEAALSTALLWSTMMFANVPAMARVADAISHTAEAQEESLGSTHWAHFGPPMLIAMAVERSCERWLPHLPAPLRRVAGFTGAVIFNFIGLEACQPIADGQGPSIDFLRYANRPETKADALAMLAGWTTYFALDNYRTRKYAKLAEQQTLASAAE